MNLVVSRRAVPISTFVLAALLVAGSFLFATAGRAEPVPVELVQVDGKWQLLRDGEPYQIRGAGGPGPLDRLAAAGANSVRTWSTDNVQSVLDEAHALGMTVTVGIWLEHERHGFDYSDKGQVKGAAKAGPRSCPALQGPPGIAALGCWQ